MPTPYFRYGIQVEANLVFPAPPNPPQEMMDIAMMDTAAVDAFFRMYRYVDDEQPVDPYFGLSRDELIPKLTAAW